MKAITEEYKLTHKNFLHTEFSQEMGSYSHVPLSKNAPSLQVRGVMYSSPGANAPGEVRASTGKEQDNGTQDET